MSTLIWMTVVVVVVALVVAVATYLTWMATRLDRLAVRVDTARAGLMAQLAARSFAAAQFAEQARLTELGEAAAAASRTTTLERLRAGDADVDVAENALSRALRSPALAAAVPDGPDRGDLLHRVDLSAAHVGLARQLYNDAVRDVRALRSRRTVRVSRLSARRPLPLYFEIDDALPARGGGADLADGGVPVQPGK